MKLIAKFLCIGFPLYRVGQIRGPLLSWRRGSFVCQLKNDLLNECLLAAAQTKTPERAKKLNNVQSGLAATEQGRYLLQRTRDGDGSASERPLTLTLISNLLWTNLVTKALDELNSHDHSRYGLSHLVSILCRPNRPSHVTFLCCLSRPQRH
jgi:hypothetical protein